jgi:phosphohistidine phosphatase
MRRLMLLRHATAAPLGEGADDLERPLAESGRAAARALGAYLKQEQLLPDLVLVSPARRTRETWDALAASLEAPVRQEPRLYDGDPERLLALVRETGAPVRGLLAIGHNPGTADLARRLVGHGDRYAFARMGKGYPPAGLAVIDFPVEDWGEVSPGTGRLDRFVTPESLGLSPED